MSLVEMSFDFKVARNITPSVEMSLDQMSLVEMSRDEMSWRPTFDLSVELLIICKIRSSFHLVQLL